MSEQTTAGALEHPDAVDATRGEGGGWAVSVTCCPACGLVIEEQWEAALMFHDGDEDETVTYCQCNRCSHLWIPGRA